MKIADRSYHNIKCVNRFRVNHYIKPLLILAIMALFVSSCFQTTKVIREPSAKTKPEWIDHPPQKADILYFVGISTLTGTLEDGRNIALNNALTKVAGFLGSKIKTVFEGQFTEMEQSLRQQIRSKSAAKVHGAHVVDTYHEKITTTEKGESKENYDVYVLVSFSKEEALKEMERQKKEKLETVKRACEYFDNGLKLEGETRFYEAKKQYLQAKEILSSLDELIEIDGGRNNENLMLKLDSHLADMNNRLSRIKFSFKVNSTDEGCRTFRSNFAATLKKHDFTVSDEQPAYEVTGEISVYESSFVMGSYAFYAEGSLTATRTADNQMIAEYPFRVKGFHKSKEKAPIIALREAGVEAGNELSSLIKKNVKKEEMALDK